MSWVNLGHLPNCPETVDRYPLRYRELIYEFGYNPVRACLDAGVKEPAKIRHLIYSIWHGCRDQTPTKTINGLPQFRCLNEALGEGRLHNALALGRYLLADHKIMVSWEASRPMIEASMATVSGGTEAMTKTEKHRRRLNAALAVARSAFEATVNEHARAVTRAAA